MERKRFFSVDSQGLAESIKNPGTEIPLDKGDKVISNQRGDVFFLRSSEQRIYDIDGNVWHDLPEGSDPSDFIELL